MTTTKYILELDRKGRRFWLAEHPDGTLEPQPPGWSMHFDADPKEISESDGAKTIAWLPIGTSVLLNVPDDIEGAKRLELNTLMLALKDQVTEAAVAAGQDATDEEIDKHMTAFLRSAVMERAPVQIEEELPGHDPAGVPPAVAHRDTVLQGDAISAIIQGTVKKE